MHIEAGRKEKYSEEIKVAKGTEIVKTPIGRIKIVPNPDYKESHWKMF